MGYRTSYTSQGRNAKASECQKVEGIRLKKGYDKNMGARPMARIIQEHIKKPLAEKVLFGDLSSDGGVVQIRVKPSK